MNPADCLPRPYNAVLVNCEHLTTPHPETRIIDKWLTSYSDAQFA